MGRVGSDLDALLKAVAASLYAAKAAGGNRYEMFVGSSESDATESTDRSPSRHDPLSYLLLLQQTAVAANEATTLEEAAGVVLR